MPEILSFVRGATIPVVTVGDIARRAGVKQNTVTAWTLRLPGTPTPIGHSVVGALYWWPDWEAWLHTRWPKRYGPPGDTHRGTPGNNG
jgi:hypothetical protein